MHEDKSGADNAGAPVDFDDPLAGLSPESREIVMRQARALRSEGKAQREANADPLPGALDGVFGAAMASAAGLQVRRLVHFDFVLLKRMGSPLLEQLAGKRGKKGTPFTDEQGYEMIWQFTLPCEEVEACLAKHGAAECRLIAKREIGMKLGPMEAIILVKSVEQEFERSFSSWIKHGAPEKEGGGETVFTGPAMKPAPKTGSGGG